MGTTCNLILRRRCKSCHGNNIGMVLHDGENHLVAVVQKLVAKRRGHQIDGFGRAPRKDNFGGRSGPDKLLHPATGRLVGIGSLLAEGMHPTMHVGIHPIVGIGNVVDHAAGGSARWRRCPDR